MGESIIADAFAKWLRLNRVAFVQARRDKRSTIAVGWPDFSIIHCGKCILIELKTDKGTLSREQKVMIEKLRVQSGMTVHVCRSIEAAVETVREWLGIVNFGTLTPESEQAELGGHPERGKQAPSASSQAGNLRLVQWNAETWVCDTVKDELLRRATADDLVKLTRK